MFSNPGEVLKRGTIAGLIVGTIIGGIIGALIGKQIDDKAFMGFLLGAAIIFIISYVNSLVMLTFADMAENINDMRQTLYSIKHNGATTTESASKLSDITPMNFGKTEEKSNTWKCKCGQVMPITVKTCQRCGTAKNDYFN